MVTEASRRGGAGGGGRHERELQEATDTRHMMMRYTTGREARRRCVHPY